METHGKTFGKRIACNNQKAKIAGYKAHSSRRGWKMERQWIMFYVYWLHLDRYQKT